MPGLEEEKKKTGEERRGKETNREEKKGEKQLETVVVGEGGGCGRTRTRLGNLRERRDE